MACFPSRIAGQVLVGSELDWIDENRGHDMIGARPRLFNQGKMPLMQRAHGGHQRDSLPGARRAASPQGGDGFAQRSEEHTSELQSLMRISYAVFCLKKKKHKQTHKSHQENI